MASGSVSMIGQIAALALGASLLVIAALHDVAARTIPNWTSVLLALLGAVLRWMDGQLLFGLALGLAVFVVAAFCWRRGWMGGGDVKLLGAVAITAAFDRSAPGHGFGKEEQDHVLLALEVLQGDGLLSLGVGESLLHAVDALAATHMHVLHRHLVDLVFGAGWESALEFGAVAARGLKIKAAGLQRLDAFLGRLAVLGLERDRLHFDVGLGLRDTIDLAENTVH